MQNQRQLAERVQFYDYKQKWENFEKKYKLENDSLWNHVHDTESNVSLLKEYKRKSEET